MIGEEGTVDRRLTPYQPRKEFYRLFARRSILRTEREGKVKPSPVIPEDKLEIAAILKKEVVTK